jgi:hypothetical protein
LFIWSFFLFENNYYAVTRVGIESFWVNIGQSLFIHHNLVPRTSGNFHATNRGSSCRHFCYGQFDFRLDQISTKIKLFFCLFELDFLFFVYLKLYVNVLIEIQFSSSTTDRRKIPYMIIAFGCLKKKKKIVNGVPQNYTVWNVNACFFHSTSLYIMSENK